MPEASDKAGEFKEPADRSGQPLEDDLWVLPGPIKDAPDDEPPGPRAGASEAGILTDWREAEAGLAAALARVAGRLGALDDRLGRGPDGWHHRLALLEAADLSWISGDRIPPDRLALWISLRLSGVQDDTAALSRAGWAVRRLTGGPGPEAGLATFLGRHDPETLDPEADRLADRAGSWTDLMAEAQDLHPITRACMGFHLWRLAGLGQLDDQMEAAVTAARIAASDGVGAVFAPLAMGGAGALRANGSVAARLARWLDGMSSATLTAMRHLDEIEAWSVRAQTAMVKRSGRTPPALRALLTEWPLISAPLAEAATGASRAAIQRNLTWMQQIGLIREITGHKRFQMWTAKT
nr:hypothetical protein [Actibacterium sp. 188UL27-1]